MKIISLVTLAFFSTLAHSSYFQTICHNADNSVIHYFGQVENQVVYLNKENEKVAIPSHKYKTISLESIDVSKVCKNNSWIKTYVTKLVFSSNDRALHGKNGLFVCRSEWNDRSTRCN